LTTTLGFTVLHASRDFAMALVDMVQQFAKLGEAVQVLGLPHEMRDAGDARSLVVSGGAIRFKQVSFSYPNGQDVLKGFDLDVAAGQRVGLVGRSGAGKTTIFSLLQRLYDPDNGEVLIDGQNIAHVTQESLRSSIAVVQQDISLFHRSLLENLRYGRPQASDEEVFRAVEAARCTEFINRLPQGFDTLVGERGMKLSGGQRQRLAIARAFLMDAPIVLLDEATSSLDTESEQSIQEALSRLFKGRTVIAIAHRLSTLDAFDRIVVLDRGCIIEDGEPQRLMHTLGAYSHMYARQMRSGAEHRA
jgi:ATP-binding cassette subfamily B protein